MVSLADSLVASSSRPLGLKMRADLTARKQQYQGRSYWVVKEPVGLRYFRFQEEEFAVLNMMRRNVSLEDIKDRFEDEFAPHKITYQDLQHFIGTLHRSGLVVSDAPGQGKQLKKRGDERNNKELLGKLSNILAIRFKGIDPERLLNAIYPYTRWLFSKSFFIFSIFLALSALLLIGVHFDVFRARLPAFESFFGPRNWLYLGIVLGVTKVIHEFGHGLLCKHFGGECHEMGVMFLVLTPCLYCNVSDSWMLPNKWHRAAIGAGGIYLEVLMASIATFVWWFSEPGMLNHLALRVMFICSISTILFNGNPLLRFDGYYILSDLIEIPNLRQKATKIMQRLAGEYCLGLEMPEDPFLPQSNQFMFALYTVAAVAYRWFIFCSILYFLNMVFEPYGLKAIGQLIALMGLYGLIVQPIWQLGKFLHVPGRMDQVKWHRVSITGAIVAAIIAAVMFIPFKRNVKCAVQVQPSNPRTVFVDYPCRIEKLHVRPGDQVEAGALLAEMSSPDIRYQIISMQAELDEYRQQLEVLNRRRVNEPEVIPQVLQIQKIIAGKVEELRIQTEKSQKLNIVAPVAGTIVSPPLRPEKTATKDTLPMWSGTPFDAKNAGLHMEPRDVLCQIADPAQLEAILAVDQKDAEFVRKDQEVTILLDAFTNQELTGTIVEVAKREMQATNPALSNMAGGQIATRTDASGIERPVSATYQALVPLDNAAGELRLGFRGKAKVQAGRQTLWGRLYRYLATTFHFYM